MTAVPPPVPPEIVEKAAKALHVALDGSGADDPLCEDCWGDATTVLAAMYGDIVEAARRDALDAAIDVIGNRLAYGSRHCAVQALADLRDATAPRTAPAASVSDQQPGSGSTPVRDSEGPQKRSEPFPPWVMQAMDDHQQQAEARMRRLLGTEATP